MARTIGPVTATSAGWKLMARTRRTMRAPISISFSRGLVCGQSKSAHAASRRITGNAAAICPTGKFPYRSGGKPGEAEVVDQTIPKEHQKNLRFSTFSGMLGRILQGAPPMPKQPAFPGLRDAMKKKHTRRELFLAEMDAVVLWTRLLALIEPHYPKAGPKGGRPPMPLETMLRVCFLQNW